jgi:hypothetical protein
MLQQEVLISQVTIAKVGQMLYFQIPLPRNTAYVEGIETATRFSQKPGNLVPPISAGLFSFGRTLMIGELKLQSCGRAGVFYTHDVKEERNVGMGDFSALVPWIPKLHSHQGSREIDPVWISGQSTMLLGSYRNKITQPIRYTLIVAVWIRINPEEEKTNKPATHDHCTSI